MNIIIPMAGMGKRLRPHTLTTPKPLIEVAGKPIVQRLCEDIISVVGEKTEEIGFIIGDFGSQVEKELIAIAESIGAKGRIYHQEQPLGTAHAIWCARQSLKGKVTVAFADTLFDAGFSMNTNEDGIIWTHKVEDPSAFGVVRKNADGTIAGFVEKPKEYVSNEAIIGIYYFQSGENLLDELQYLIDNNVTKGGEYQLTDALQNMLDKGLKFKTNDVKEWLDCGNPLATIQTNCRVLALKDAKEQLIAKDVVCNNTTIIPPVSIAEGVELNNSVVGPYVSIGKQTKVSGSVIANSIVGRQTTITDSVLSQSMIGNNVRLVSKPQHLSLGDYSETEL